MNVTDELLAFLELAKALDPQTLNDAIVLLNIDTHHPGFLEKFLALVPKYRDRPIIRWESAFQTHVGFWDEFGETPGPVAWINAVTGEVVDP